MSKRKPDLSRARSPVSKPGGPADTFDIVVLPHGATRADVVIGTMKAGTSTFIKSGEKRRVKRGRAPKSNVLDRGAMAAAAVQAALARAERRTPAPVDRMTGKDAKGLLGELADTMQRLAEGRARFRSDMAAAIEKGEALRKKAAG